MADPTVARVAIAKARVAMRVSDGAASFQTNTAATRMAQARTTRASQTHRSIRRGSSIS
jgi:hypothetical protein